MNESLVSIVVPSYNHEHYILECLQSLYEQTHKRLELIVVDDHSSDHTFEFTRKLLDTAFSRRFERVILKRQDVNQGAHVSLNLGLKLATGEYIAIVNSDDRFRSRRIELLLAAMLKARSEFAFSAICAFEDKLTYDVQLAKDLQSHRNLPENILLLDLRQRLAIAREVSIGYALIRQNVAISTGNFVFSRRLAEAVGGFQPLRYCHDWDFILQALVRTQPVYVDEALYDYRLHPTNSFRGTQHLAQAETEVVLRRFFRAILTGSVSNLLCPTPERAAGYFEYFIRSAKYDYFWARENGLPTTSQRVYAATPTDRTSSVEAFMRLAGRN